KCPGIVVPRQSAGMRTSHILESTAVTVLREKSPGDSRGGYVLEMSGAPAEGTLYASLHHLIVIPHAQAGLPDHAQHKAYRLAGLRTAVYLSRASFDHSPASLQSFAAVGPDEESRADLPRVAYVRQTVSRRRRPAHEKHAL